MDNEIKVTPPSFSPSFSHLKVHAQQKTNRDITNARKGGKEEKAAISDCDYRVTS